MGHHRSTVDIDAPPEYVWRVLTDAERRPEWEDAIVAVRDVTGPMDQVGASWLEVRRGRSAAETTLEVTRVEKPRVIAWTGPLPAGARLLFTVTLEPRDGGTHKIVELEYTLPGGPFGRLLDKLVVQRVFTKQTELHASRSDANLKALVEREYAESRDPAPS